MTASTIIVHGIAKWMTLCRSGAPSNMKDDLLHLSSTCILTEFNSRLGPLKPSANSGWIVISDFIVLTFDVLLNSIIYSHGLSEPNITINET